ncbi:7-cyano-7-deazaguanine synthase ExsB [Helicobacter sp. NHP21005]|uniref:7-cyano-7-deazaguanine synthase QueC n=1 Tax=Helicobacter felistomachi TaxID=3040201 RepID=UPI0025730FF0|nr:7-cyano-7-deazaguanine synthase QueC [Helicobacter sp. NHP21005]BEG56722.1 7-cyano-7-deazaguanine synthase ExsB [Helicobacter sp. NHP21005]
MILEKTYNASCVLCFSGGQDSTTLALWAKQAFKETHLLAFNYAQKHAIELKQAQKIAKLLGLPLKVLDLSFLQEITLSALFANNPQKSSTPHPTNPNLPASFVPDRNALFFTLAHAYAFNLGANFVLVGVSQQDYSGYFDCRKEFLDSLQTSLNLGAFGIQEGISFLAPFMDMSKAQEFALAQDLGALELILEHTHTCYEGVRGVRHAYGYGCGACPSCHLRQSAYEEFLKDYKQN